MTLDHNIDIRIISEDYCQLLQGFHPVGVHYGTS